jgi:hypothetical protein
MPPKSYNYTYIGVSEFDFLRKEKIVYTGFVIGVGYAFVRMENQPVKGSQSSFFSHLVFIQELDTSEEAMRQSYPPVQSSDKHATLSATIRTGSFYVRHRTEAEEIGEYERGKTNISTNATRFARSRDILNMTSIMGEKDGIDEGSQIGAFRHALWQSTITNRFGISIAVQAGNVHEENPLANTSLRHLKTRQEADEIVDLLNNRIGRSIGKKHPANSSMKTLANRVLTVFYEDGLYTMHQNADGTFYIDRTKISDVQYKLLREHFEKVNDVGRTEEDIKQAEKEAREKKEGKKK